MKTNFMKQVFQYLYPKKNRVIAAVAFVRTFGQTVTGVFTVGASGLIVVSVNDLQAIDWTTVGWTAGALVLSAVLSGLKAFSDVSRNGLNSKYVEALEKNDTQISTDIKAALRPSFFVPAPAAAKAAPKAAPKPVAKKAAPKKAATAVANKVVENTMKANQAPAVELPN